MDEQNKNKEQFIIAYITDFDDCTTPVSHAVFLSQMIHKDVILLYICDKRYTTLLPDEAETNMKQLNDRMQSTYPQCKFHYCVLSGETEKVINTLPTLLNAVAITTRVDKEAKRKSPIHKSNILNDFKSCKTAYLVAQKPLDNTASMNNIAMTIDFKKESKDKLIWSSYYARFNKSSVSVLYYDYKDEFLKNKWYSNMKFLHMFYTNLNLTFVPSIIPSKSTFPDINALNYIEDKNIGLLITVTTKEKDAMEFIIGVQEQKTIVNDQKIPILFLNPREDLYVLCD